MRKNLRDARVRNNITQEDLAKHIGISYSSYRYLESGATQGKPWQWDRLEDFLKVPQRKLREDFPGETNTLRVKAKRTAKKNKKQ